MVSINRVINTNIMNFLKSELESKVNELTKLYIIDRDVPAMDELAIIPVLLYDTGKDIIQLMKGGSNYMLSMLVPDTAGDVKVVGNSYTMHNLWIPAEQLNPVLADYNCTLRQFNLALRRELQNGPKELINLYVKFYTTGKRYSAISNADRVGERSDRASNTVYSLYFDHPFNIPFEMDEYLYQLTSQSPSNETSDVSISFGKLPRSL